VKLVIVPAALAELHDAAAFYAASANVELGLAFVEEFERAVDAILAGPEIGAVFRRARRRYLLRRFPYSVIYQQTHEEVRIIAVAHQRRRPSYWIRRR
jgi:toxin ParE1/3/4